MMPASVLTEYITSNFQWFVLCLSALLIGMSKTGIQGINTISIPLLAVAFGAKASTGLILPMLCFADIIAVIWYRRNAEWKIVMRLLPAAAFGFIIALTADNFIDDRYFKLLMAICIFAGIAVMLYTEKSGSGSKWADKKWYGPAFGVLGGFTTMIGNAAGPIMAVYMLSMKLPKRSFVGTSAWFFLIVNYLKLPLQIFVWDNINIQSLTAGAVTIPFILSGAIVGIYFIKKVPERSFRKVILVLTILSTLMLLF